MLGQPGSLRRGAAAVLLGNGVFNACRLAALMLLAKATTPEIVGQFETGMAIATPVVLFCAMELRSVLVADAASPPFARYRAIRRIGMLVAITILAGVLLCHMPYESAGMIALLAGVFGMRLALQTAELDWGIYQRNERLDLLGWSNAQRGVSMLSLFALGILGGRMLQWPLVNAASTSIGLTVLAWISVSCFFDRPRTVTSEPAPSFQPRSSEGWRIVRDALPLTVVALLIAFCDSIPRLVLRGQDQGLRSLGHFGAIAYLPMAAHFVILQIGLAASRGLAVRFQTDRAAFLRLVTRLTVIALVLSVAMLTVVGWFGKTILTVAFTDKYAEHADAFRTLTLAHCFLLLASIWGYVLTQMRQFWSQVPVHLAITVATFVGAFWLIPQNQVSGTAECMLLRSVAHAVLYGVLLFTSLRSAKIPAAG